MFLQFERYYQFQNGDSTALYLLLLAWHNLVCSRLFCSADTAKALGDKRSDNTMTDHDKESVIHRVFINGVFRR